MSRKRASIVEWIHEAHAYDMGIAMLCSGFWFQLHFVKIALQACAFVYFTGLFFFTGNIMILNSLFPIIIMINEVLF